MGSSHRIRELSFAEFEALCKQGDRVTVFRELREDTGTPVSAFLRGMREAPNAFLLESVEGGERWARHSFLGMNPRRVMEVRGGRILELVDGERREIRAASPLEALRQMVGRSRVARAPGLPRFVGGLVGYLSYGTIRWFEPRIPQRHGPDPRFPDSEWMWVDRPAAFDNLRHTLQLIACVEPAQHRTAKAAYLAARRSLDELEEALEGELPRGLQSGRPTQVQSAWDRGPFTEAVERVKEYIRAGDCMQVVLSRRVEARYRGDPFELYRRIRAHNPAPYLHYLRFGDRILAGASPEVLVRVEEGTVTVRPIAGTRRRGATREEDLALEQDLRRDPKELAEHVMLVDLGRNDVGRVSAVGTVRVEEREVTERYAHVMHLVSQVSGRLQPGLDALDAVAAAFPAGTVSGAPKVRAMEIIDELEPVSRGPYAGAVGYLGFDGNLDLAISIRSVALSGSTLRFQAGAGLVYDSDPDREFEETEHKMRGMLVALGVSPEEIRAEPAPRRRTAAGGRR